MAGTLPEAIQYAESGECLAVQPVAAFPLCDSVWGKSKGRAADRTLNGAPQPVPGRAVQTTK